MVTVTCTNGGVDECHRNLMLDKFSERELLLERESANIGGAHPNGVIRSMAALEQRIGSQFITHNSKEIVVGRASTANQLIHKRLVHVVIQRGERANVGIERYIFVKCRSGQNQVEGGDIEVHRGVGHVLERFRVAHVVGGKRHKLIKESVFERVRQRAVGRTAANRGIGTVVHRDEGFNASHTGTALIVLSCEREGAVERILRVELRMECGSRSNGIESVAPDIGADGRVVVEDDKCFGSDSIARLHSTVRQNVETDISFPMTQRIVNRQEAHLRAGRFETSGGVNTLENPEKLVIHNIDTRGHIDPDAQGIRHIQTLAIG